MSKVFHIGDPHLGHKNILECSGGLRGGSTPKEHDDWFIDQWNSKVTKRDTVWVHGDVVFDRAVFPRLAELKGYKRLLLGNHDRFRVEEYLKYFNTIHGLVRYKGYWLSHAPIHPDHLRGLKNIHAHLHKYVVRCGGYGLPDKRYINVSVEQLNGIPVSRDELMEK